MNDAKTKHWQPLANLFKLHMCSAAAQMERMEIGKHSPSRRGLSQFPKARLLRRSFKHSTPRPSLCLSKRPMGGSARMKIECRCILERYLSRVTHSATPQMIHPFLFRAIRAVGKSPPHFSQPCCGFCICSINSLNSL